MTENDLLELILNRLGCSETAQAIFGSDEIKEWSSLLIETLIENRLLQQTQPAKTITCQGCEQYCTMPVIVLPQENSRLARAFIVCDKRDDIGRVPVDLKRLEQWEMNGSLLAKKLSSLLAFDKTAKVEIKGKRWVLGTFRGKERRSQLGLNIEDGVFIKVAGHDLPLADVLSFKNSKITLDQDELSRFVDKPLTESVSGKLSTTRREAQKLISQDRYSAWKKAYKQLKRKHPHMSDIWYSKKIAKMDIAQGRDADTIRKHMKK